MSDDEWPAYECCGRKSLHTRGCVNEVQKRHWDGSRQGIEAICAWANQGLDPLEEPFVMYEFTGPDDVDGVTVATDDGEYASMEPGDTLVKTHDGFRVT